MVVSFVSVASDTARRQNLTTNSPLLCLLQFFCPVFLSIPRALGVGAALQMYPLGLGSTGLRFDCLWPSVMISVYCKERILLT